MTMSHALACILLAAVAAACGEAPDSARHEEAEPEPALDRRAALEELAEALLYLDDEERGGYLGARFVASLDEGPGGEPLVRIFAGSPSMACGASSVVEAAVCGNRLGKGTFLFQTFRPVRPDLREIMVEVCNEQFEGLDFVLTDDPWEANVYALETTFVPNPRHADPMNADNNYSAYTMTAKSDPPVSIIALNTGGSNDFTRAIEEGDPVQLEATFLNEMMNALGVMDLQNVDTTTLSRPNQVWGARLERDHGNDALDRFTITDSNHSGPGNELLELDRMIVRRILEEAARRK